MFKKIASLTLAAFLTTGLAIAQDPTAGTSQQQQTTVGQPTDMNEPLFKGCVSGTKDNYVLTAEDGRQFRLHSDKDINEHVGKFVEIRGSVKKEKVDRPDSAQTGGTKFSEMDVADIKNVDGKTCPATTSDASMSTEQKSEESAAASTDAAASTSSTETATTEAKPEADMNASSTDASAATSTTTEPEKKEEAASSNFYGTEQKPVEQKTDAAVAEVKEESKEAVAEVKEESKDAAAAVENKTEEVKPEADAAVSTDATATQNNAVANDQATASDASAQNTADASAELPQTASPLPLLGLLGLISAGFGFISRRK